MEMAKRDEISSFIEGFSAPFIEIAISILFSGVSEVIQIISGLIKDSSLFILSTNILYQSLTFVAVADFIRNLLIGLVFPGDAIMHLFGEIISLLIVFFIPFFNEVLKSQLWSIILIILGMVIRIYLELKRTNRD
ncbi:MAG: hypothetical protein QXK24_04190 [Ignisphaera sp.]